MSLSAVGRQERDTPTHLIKNRTSTHDGRVSKDRIVMGVTREVNSTRDQLLHDQLSADQLFTRSTSLSQLL